MNLDLDLASDFNVVDGLELMYLSPAGTSETVELPRAHRRRVNSREAAPSRGKYTIHDTVISFPCTDLESPPEVGSIVYNEEKTELFYTMSKDRIVFDTQWQCICRRGMLQSELADIVTIQHNIGGVDEDGAAYKSWQDYLSQHPAAIQEMDAVLENDKNNRTMIDRTFKIYTTAPREIKPGMRVVGPDKKVYNIKRVTGKNEIGMPLVLDAMLARSPGAE